MSIRPEHSNHDQALKRAQAWDRNWFSRHPERLFRIRRIIPNEVVTAAPQDNQTLVHYDPIASTFARVPISSPALLSNDEEFLAAVWVWFKANKAPGEMLSMPPEQHLRLLQLTGIEA